MRPAGSQLMSVIFSWFQPTQLNQHKLDTKEKAETKIFQFINDVSLDTYLLHHNTFKEKK